MSQVKQIENLFLSVGAMKAGTTWVYDKLQHHPQINFSREKEVHYFAHVNHISKSLDDVKLKRRAKASILKAGKLFKAREIDLAEFRSTVDWYLNYSVDHVDDNWYLNLFGDHLTADSDCYCADFSNLTCFLDDKGWEHIHKLAKNIRSIYILRDPISRLWSHYKFHLQFIGHENQDNPDKNHKLFRSLISKPWFIRNSLYMDNITRVRNHLGEDKLKVFYLEDISGNPSVFFKEIHSFLEISDFDYSFMDIEERKNTSISKKIPDEWYDEIKSALQDEIMQLKAAGLFHESWRF
ncbi:sulfotransferase domain-containing protein [Leucothrix mucor]|uniref:sulfotransferase domain-containing protein n=1 Tax=Leucothrix mucor TaxID=45248 RepID=UPI0003B5E62F|nr:sulfotransferase domain-containing protein [Leucothrix mucor]